MTLEGDSREFTVNALVGGIYAPSICAGVRAPRLCRLVPYLY